MAAFLFGRRDGNQGEEGGEGGQVRGQGEDNTPEGWTFFNFDSFERTELYFWQKVNVTCSQKVNFNASHLVMQFYCQLEIRYHVTRARGSRNMLWILENQKYKFEKRKVSFEKGREYTR